MSFSPSGTTLAFVGQGGIQLWEVNARRSIATLKDGSSVKNVVFSANGKMLASAGRGGRIQVWEVSTKRVVNTLTCSAKSVDSVCFSPDGSRLTSASDDATVRLWDVTTEKPIATLEGHQNPVV